MASPSNDKNIILIEMSNFISVTDLVDQIFHLQDFYYLLSRSKVTSDQLNPDFVDSLIEDSNSKYVFKHVELEELDRVEKYEKTEKIVNEIELNTYGDLLTLIYYVLSKFDTIRVGEKPESTLRIIDGAQEIARLDVNDEGIMNLVAPLIVNLQSLGLRDDRVGYPVVEVDVGKVLSTYERAVNSLKVLLEETDYEEMFEEGNPRRDIMDELIRNNRVLFDESKDGRVVLSDSSFDGSSFDTKFVNETLYISSVLINNLLTWPYSFNILERLADLQYYYRLSSTLATYKGRLEVEWTDFLTDLDRPMKGDRIDENRYAERKANIAEKSDVEFEEFDYSHTVSNGIEDVQGDTVKYVDVESLPEIQKLTELVLTEAMSSEEDESNEDLIVDHIFFRLNIGIACHLVEPLIRYYEQQDYSKVGNRFGIVETKYDFIEMNEMVSEILRIEDSLKDLPRTEQVNEFYNSKEMIFDGEWAEIITFPDEVRVDLRDLLDKGLKLESSLSKRVTFEEESPSEIYTKLANAIRDEDIDTFREYIPMIDILTDLDIVELESNAAAEYKYEFVKELVDAAPEILVEGGILDAASENETELEIVLSNERALNALLESTSGDLRDILESRDLSDLADKYL